MDSDVCLCLLWQHMSCALVNTIASSLGQVMSIPRYRLFSFAKEAEETDTLHCSKHLMGYHCAFMKQVSGFTCIADVTGSLKHGARWLFVQ